MSEKKKVIRVKDLVIEAENVFIEPQRKEHHDRKDRVDPFFGGRRRKDDVAGESKDRHDESSSSRGGFSWI
ncbi:MULTISPECIES: hypothetical protein [Halobacillus]|uniref:Uncharacterized protein n=1 Tax=Halobacillus halophilus (strain ATCC 35676 / DSM 2266 / JCM 20832 / KCTC 3685 / LMG 17431 / NBRC 102448 / NCIMB 2269) TaxID=866895 RepID=I0JKM5_HALH3|nr:hypothetical protein [Halobacillus halophilus]ASF38831.1 hypothetical protein CEH05_06760 [Halobacillus halophilus]CCG44694.1 hypothetical protein HBHAL_2348 [Halobacillus halophilus DSM 2266]